MPMNRLDQVRESMNFLVQEHGFVVTQGRYDAQHFGDTLVLLKSPTHLLKIIVGRGEVFVEVASTDQPDLYFDLAVVLEHLTHQEWNYDFKVDTGEQLKRLAGILKLYSQEIFEDQVVRHHRRELGEIVRRQAEKRWKRFNFGQ